jgi:NTE family protein
MTEATLQNQNSTSNTKKKVAIALQGGGAHGAFAWGVMDKLLEDGRFDIMGVSGTSAGGMNAASVVQGLIKGNEETARSTLKEYWRSMNELSKKISPFAKKDPFKELGSDPSAMAYMNMMSALWGKMMPYMANPFEEKKEFNLSGTPEFHMYEMMGSMFSPYDTNPNDVNPFRDFLANFFDFKAIRENQERKIFLGTTHVKTGKIKVFSNADFSADVLMASACLPFLFQAVQIDGEHYWDGGFIANPAIYPLIGLKDTKDIIIVQLTRTHCDKVPTKRHEIVDRLKEITYNGCLVREMRAIHFVTKLIDDGLIREGALPRINMHLIKNENTFKNLNLSSALNTDWDFLMMLHEEGRATAERWIRKNYDTVGTINHKMDDETFKDFIS